MRLLEAYADLPLSSRFYLGVRRRLLRPEAVKEALGPRESVLDLATGFGLVPNYLGMSGAARRVVGVDMDPERVAAARRAAERSGSGAKFQTGDIRSFEGEGFDAVCLLDSLHYFGDDDKEKLLGVCRKALLPGGHLLLRQPVSGQGARSSLVKAQEWLMTRAAVTRTAEDASRLEFPSPAELASLIESCGFKLLRMSPPGGLHPYPDMTFFAARV